VPAPDLSEYDASDDEPSSPGPVLTTRLRLEPLRPETLVALLDGDRAGVVRAQGRQLPEEFYESSRQMFLKVQLDRITARPTGRGWCARAIVRQGDGVVIGDCGFHGPPADVGRAEIGYMILPPYRRQGYATEAVEGLVGWARAQGETVVFASVAPDNVASLAVVATAGFRQTGRQNDDTDGEELVFELSL
jgi:[ribosomal protein S5]-alanine N-acetyltransferase